MKLNFSALLKNKTVLYSVFFLAIVNFFGFLLTRNLNAVIFFLLIGYLTSHFSKNMIVVMLVSIITTNLLFKIKDHSFYEGMESKDNEKKNKKENEKKEGLQKLKPAKVKEGEEGGDDSALQDSEVDFAATLETAYSNLDKMLSSDELKSMSDDTQRLAERQTQLAGNIKKIQPLMDKTTSMLDNLNIDKLESVINNLASKLNIMDDSKK